MPADTESTDGATRAQGAQRRRVRLPAPGRVLAVPLPTLPRMPSLPKLSSLPAFRRLELLKPQLPGIKLPPPERLAFYAAMGVMGVAEVIEWPVVLAVLASQAVARRSFGEAPWERRPAGSPKEQAPAWAEGGASARPAEGAGGAGAGQHAGQTREPAGPAGEPAGPAGERAGRAGEPPREASSPRPRRSPAAQRGRAKAAAPPP
jgi:hypothetical protein